MQQKPIDRWLGLAGIAGGILFFLLPKVPVVILASTVAIFVILVHPAWNFWWVEKSLLRRFAALVCLAVCCIGAAYIAWPTPQPAVPTASAIAEELVRLSTDPRNQPAAPRDASPTAGITNQRKEVLKVPSPQEEPVNTEPDQGRGAQSELLKKVRLLYDRGPCKVQQVTNAGATIPLKDQTENFAFISLPSGDHVITVRRPVGTKDFSISVDRKRQTIQTLNIDCNQP